MAELITLPIALLGILDPEVQQTQWATTFETYSTVEECVIALPAMQAFYRTEWPYAMLWCAQPVEDMTILKTSPRPKPNPRRT